MRLSIGLVLIGGLLASGKASAQGFYLDDQQEGFGAALGASTNDDATTLSLLAGYSFKGFIDAGTFLHRYSFDDTGPLDLTAIGLNPYVNVHLLRQNDSLPVSVAAMGNVQKLFFSSDADGLDMSGWSMFLGGAVYRKIVLTDRFFMSPQATLGFAHTSVTTEVQGLGENTEGEGTLFFQLAGNLGIRDDSGRIWAINPFLSIDEDNATFGLFAGIVLPR